MSDTPKVNRTSLRRIESKGTVLDLAIADKGWAVPWAMVRNEKDEYFLNGNYACHSGPHGTVQMIVELTEKGYIVYVPPKFHYEKKLQERIAPWFTIPVIQVIRDSELKD